MDSAMNAVGKALTALGVEAYVDTIIVHVHSTMVAWMKLKIYALENKFRPH